MGLLDGVTCHRILPVGAAAQGCNLRIGITALVAKVFLLQSGPLAGAEQIQFPGNTAHANAVTVTYITVLLAKAALLCGDQNHTVGSS